MAGDSPITISERAARRIAHLIARDDNADVRLRVAVAGGGCSGFQYGFSLDERVEDGETVVERDGAKVVVDALSLMYLAGSEVDYVDDIAGSHFTITNPNATSSCSCGNSFAVAM